MQSQGMRNSGVVSKANQLPPWWMSICGAIFVLQNSLKKIQWTVHKTATSGFIYLTIATADVSLVKTFKYFVLPYCYY